MNIHHYCRETGIFLGSEPAQPDPLEVGVWIVPAHATLKEPPPQLPGHSIVFTKDSWEYKELPEPDLEAERAEYIGRLYMFLQYQLSLGIVVNGKRFPSDPLTRSVMIGFSLHLPRKASITLPLSESAPLDAGMVKEYRKRLSLRDADCYYQESIHRLALQQHPEPGTYDFRKGWPA